MRVVTMAVTHTKGTERQQLDLEKARDSLTRRIVTWRRSQAVHMSHAMALAEAAIKKHSDGYAAKEESVPPEAEPLILPSHFLPSVRTQKGLDNLASIEQSLRLGSATDALRDLRSELRLTSALLHFKGVQLRGQAQGTRARQRLKTSEGRMQEAAARYRRARTALISLGVDAALVRELRVEDIKRMAEWAFDDGLTVGEGHRELPWIWLVDGITLDVVTNVATNDGT